MQLVRLEPTILLSQVTHFPLSYYAPMTHIKLKVIDLTNKTGIWGQYFVSILTIMSVPSTICKNYSKEHYLKERKKFIKTCLVKLPHIAVTSGLGCQKVASFYIKFRMIMVNL